jgi:CheY-like chemotaxis protein
MLHAIREVLEPDHRVTLAPDGRCALALYESERPDVVLLDLLMPDMNGIEVVEKIQRIDPDAKIVVLTCLDEAREAVRLFRLGVVDYLVKPVDPAELKETVRKALTSSPAPRPAHVETPTSLEAERAVKRAVLAHQVLMLYGRPGSGRRTALKRACEELSIRRILFVDAEGGSLTAVLRAVLDHFDDTAGAVCLRFHGDRGEDFSAARDARRVVLRVRGALSALRQDAEGAPAFIAGIVDVERDPFALKAGPNRLTQTPGVTEVYMKSPRERPEELRVLVHHFSAMCSGVGHDHEADLALVDDLHCMISSRPKLDNLRFVRAASVKPGLVSAADRAEGGGAKALAVPVP